MSVSPGVSPGALRARLGAAMQRHQANDLAGAERAYREVLRAAPDHPDALHLIGVLLAQSGRAAEGAEHLRRAVARAPGNAMFLNNLGNAELAAGNPDAAAAAYADAVRHQPEFADALFNLGNAERVRKRFDAAVDCFRRALAVDPRQPRVLINLGMTLYLQGRLDDAVDTIRRAIALDPRPAVMHYDLGVVLQRQGKVREAIDAYRAAVERDPGVAEVHAKLGFAWQEIGEQEAAARAFRRALEINPDLLDAHLGLGGHFHDRGRLDEAVAALERALALDPRHVIATVNLGRTLQEQGRSAEAVETYRRALALEPGQKGAQANLGIVLQELGRRDEAREVFDLERLVRILPFERVAGWGDVAAFNRDLARHIYEHPTLMLDRPARSTTNGHQTLELLHSEAPVARALGALIEEGVRRFIEEDLRASGNRYVQDVPERWRLDTWAVVIGSGGYQSPHIHPHAFASGVYYVQLPEVISAGEDGQAGWIKFGQTRPSDDGDPSQAGFLTRVVQPGEGMMVLFPSHFWHHTIPFESDRDRICVAFDAIAV